MGAGVCAVQDVVEPPDPTAVPRLGTEKLSHKGEMIVEAIARHQPVGSEKPNPSAAEEPSGLWSGKELLAFAVRAGRRDRQHRGDFGGVEIVASEPQGYEGFAIGIFFSLRRGGCQAAGLAHP